MNSVRSCVAATRPHWIHNGPVRTATITEWLYQMLY